MIGDDLARTDVAERTTLDDLFRRAAVRNPDAIALVDPDNRASFTDGEARQLTYAQADRAIWAIAARLQALSLRADNSVAYQLPNTVDSVLLLLGILRAGLIAAPLPMLWRKSEIVAALSQVEAKALVTTSRIGEADHCDITMQAAAELFSVRHVCGFGDGLPDGVVSLQDVFSDGRHKLSPPTQCEGNPARYRAVITFEPATRGIQPIMRNHAQLIAGGMALLALCGINQGGAILSATPISSFAGIAVTLLPWLLSGGPLVLHQPFNADIFVAQQRVWQCNAVVVPGPLAAALSDTGHFDDIATMLALWRAPERPDREQWHGRAPLCDITAFGEFGLIASRRGHGDIMAPLPFGAPHTSAVIEGKRTSTGTLALRGAMVAGPRLAAPEDHGANASEAVDGFVDTFYQCRVEHDKLVVAGPQPGMVGIGGYRIARGEIDAMCAALPPDSLIAALPDALTGQRLKGRAVDPAAAKARLVASGANPLLAGAFHSPGREFPTNEWLR
jgi:non-ribosomal peptide synthetase component E (peptide arylation enzyme)